MPFRYFQVDAFADAVFGGNPAGVVPLDTWPEDALLQRMAGEHNLSETAFLCRDRSGEEDFLLRWMTPVSEVDLCGHATLSAAHVLWEHLGWSGERVTFSSHSGRLTVRRVGDLYELDFPALRMEPIDDLSALTVALGGAPVEAYRGLYDVAVFESQDDIEGLHPDHSAIARLDGVSALGVTAPGREQHFVSRLFAPRLGIAEDPVTGSLHSLLAPYWSERLGVATLDARQVSRRGGELRCTVDGDRVRIAGRAVTYLQGEILLGE
ncbi:MAG: PhzF family phenazine biosynthesis protein [Planctomycetota bacterium]